MEEWSIFVVTSERSFKCLPFSDCFWLRKCVTKLPLFSTKKRKTHFLKFYFIQYTLEPRYCVYRGTAQLY